MDGSQLTLARSSCSNNSAASAGGAFVVLDGAKLACSGRCTFAANSAALGGAIAAQSAAVALTDAVLASNTAPGDLVTVAFGNSQQRAGSGGALFAANATVQLRSSSFRRNTADVQGGALQLVSSRAVAVGTTFVGNKAAASGDTVTGAAGQQQQQQRATAGGAIAVGLLPSASSGNKMQAAVLSLQRCTLSDNSAGFGGAVAAINTEVDLQAPAPSDTSAAVSAGAAAPVSISLNDSVASNNTAAVAGGGLFSNLPGAAISISGSKVLSNTAGRGGGGLAAVTPASFNTASSSVSSNTATYCGGLLLDTPAKDSRFQGSRFESNTAGQLDAQEQQAGAEGRQLLASSEASFGQLPKWNNTGSGGGMCIAPGGVVSVTKSIITKNSALHGGEQWLLRVV
jgi:predicted outer membrane repeat protein